MRRFQYKANDVNVGNLIFCNQVHKRRWKIIARKWF